jgi:large subunit ribosomal protein L4
MNKKERKLAIRTAFMNRAVEDLIVVENFAEQITSPKTKEVVSALVRWGVDKEAKILIIVNDSIPDNFYLSARNLPNVKIIKHDCLNVFDLLNADKIVATSEAITKLQEVYSGE